MNKKSKFVLAAVALLLTGCNGWPKTLPYTEARTRPEKYPTYAATAADAVPMFYAGNRRYMVMPTEANVRTLPTTGVSTQAPVSVFALTGDEPPYSVLFARTADGRTHFVAPID